MKTSSIRAAVASTLMVAPTVWAQTGDAQGAGNFALEEIVVTAQRREETLQHAAVAIDAATGENLIEAGITNAVDLSKLVPALTINSGGGANASIFMRGVGTRTNNSYVDSAIAMSYDGVFMGRSSAASGTAFYDLERVEVLKGPQGILYGRNATGGAINVLPAKPNMDGVSGYGMLSLGSYSELQTQGALNLPVSDSSAMRFAFTRVKHDGYNKDGTNDADSLGFRAQYLIKPSDDLSIRVGADYTKQGGVGAGSSYVGRYDAATGYTFIPSGLPDDEGLVTAAANAYRQTLLAAPGFGFLSPITETLYQDYKYTGVNAEINLNTDIGTWTFIPGWRKSEGDSKFDMPGFNTGWVQDKNTQTSAELRLTSVGGQRVDYIAGLYYFDESSDSNNTYNQEFVLPLQLYTHNAQSSAAFGQLTFNATDRFRLVGGARYTHDKKDIDGVIDNFIVFCGGAPPANLTPPASFGNGCAVPGNLPHFPTLDTPAQALAWLIANNWVASSTTLTGGNQNIALLNGKGAIRRVNTPVVDSSTESKVTWKVSAQYDVAPDSLLYATYETGYRAGGLQLAEGTPTYKPEYLNAASVGSKNRFLNGRLQLNAEAFLWKYTDQQINYFTLSPSGTLVNSTQNVGRATNQGIDVDLLFAATRTTQLSARVQYLDATYDDLHFITASPRDNFGCPFTLTGATAGGQPVKDFNCAGMPAIYSPKYTVNLGIDQTFPLGSMDLVASVYSTWRDDQWGSIEYIKHEFVPAYSKTDASLALRQPDGKWSVTTYAQNLENKRRSLAVPSSPLGTGQTSFGAPTTYGVRLLVSF